MSMSNPAEAPAPVPQLPKIWTPSPRSSPQTPLTRKRGGGGGAGNDGGDGDGPQGSPEHMLTLELALVEEVPALQLGRLLSTLESVYVASLWLGRAEESSGFLEDYWLADDDILWIEQLEIGTPNKLKLRGKTQGMVAVVAFLGSVLGLPVAATEAYKNYAEAQKAFVEKDWVRIQIVEKAQQLLNEQRISDDGFQRITRLAEDIASQPPSALGIVAPKPMVLSRAQHSRYESESAGNAEVLSPAAQAILRQQGYAGAASLFEAYFRARQNYFEHSEPAALAELQRTYSLIREDLKISDDDLHRLLERLEPKVR